MLNITVTVQCSTVPCSAVQCHTIHTHTHTPSHNILIFQLLTYSLSQYVLSGIPAVGGVGNRGHIRLRDVPAAGLLQLGGD
jgi:hypothetical protein